MIQKLINDDTFFEIKNKYLKKYPTEIRGQLTNATLHLSFFKRVKQRAELLAHISFVSIISLCVLSCKAYILRNA